MSYSKLSWSEAREVCKRENDGDLASVHNSFEQGKTKMKPKVFKFFKPSEDHVNADEDIGPSPGHFDRFPNFARRFPNITQDTFEDF